MLEFIIVSVILVLIYVAYQIYDYKREQKKVAEMPSQSPVEEFKNPEVLDLSKLQPMTLQDVHYNNGTTGRKTYVAIRNIVFDVSSSDAYKEDGAYFVFAGQDATVALGKMDMSGKYLNEYGITQMPEDEMANMNSWFSYFYSKYPVIGKVKNAKDD